MVTPILILYENAIVRCPFYRHKAADCRLPDYRLSLRHEI